MPVDQYTSMLLVTIRAAADACPAGALVLCPTSFLPINAGHPLTWAQIFSPEGLACFCPMKVGPPSTVMLRCIGILRPSSVAYPIHAFELASRLVYNDVIYVTLPLSYSTPVGSLYATANILRVAANATLPLGHV